MAKSKKFIRREEIEAEFSALMAHLKSGYPITDALDDFVPGGMSWKKGASKNSSYSMALCPFHQEKTPSFTAYNATNTYVCSSTACGKRGDVFKLVQQLEPGLDFNGVVQAVADAAGASYSDKLAAYFEQKKEARLKGYGGKTKPVTKADLAKYDERLNRRLAEAPEQMAEDEFLAIPKGAPRPKVGVKFALWRDDPDRPVREQVWMPEPKMVHNYRNAYGDLLMSVLRCVKVRDGRKYFLPARIGPLPPECPKNLVTGHDQDGRALGWVCGGPADGAPKPIYGMEDVIDWLAKGGKHVLLVEGEKTRDAAKRLIASSTAAHEWLVLSPMGGGSSSIYADWEDFMRLIGDREVNFAVWPDADRPVINRQTGEVTDAQRKYSLQTMSAVRQRALDFGATGVKRLFRVLPPEAKKHGWDLADAEEEGWNGDMLLDYIRSNVKLIDEASLTLRETDPENAKDEVDSVPEMAMPA